MDRIIIESLEKQAELMKDFKGKKPVMEAEIDAIFADLIGMIRKNSSLEADY